MPITFKIFLESQNNLIDEFLDENKRQISFYKIRDNCGPAALDFISFCKKKGMKMKKISGFFKADHVVYEKNDFTKEMINELKADGYDFNKSTDRKKFLESNPKYREEWKLIPHFWAEDSEGNLYDPSGKLQFIDTKLSSDLNKSRYKKEKEWDM